MAGKIQKQDVKTEAELIGAGAAASDLINDTQIYVTGAGINKTLDDAIADGDIAGSLAANSVTNTELADMADSTIKGRAVGAGSGDPTDLTGTQATAILNNFVGDSGAGGTKGLVPAPAAGDAAANRFLKADGTWTAPGGGGAISVTTQVFTASGTWNKPSGALYVEVEVVGGGGGSGDASSAISSSPGYTGGGGGGGYAMETYLASALGASETVTIGAGGTAGAPNGGTGGTSSFGAFISATGGGGSTAAGANATSGGGAGGTGSGGIINIQGARGDCGSDTAGGGNSMKGFGAQPTTSVQHNATAGQVYGGGASGARAQAGSATVFNGAAGAAGVVIVKTYRSV